MSSEKKHTQNVDQPTGISRYTREEMARVWSEEAKFTAWLKVVRAVCEVQAELGLVPKKLADELAEQAVFSIPKIREIEQKVRHETIAFLTNVSEGLSKDAGRFLHYGMTSSDIIDNGYNLQIRAAIKVLRSNIQGLSETLLAEAIEHKYTTCMGRTHGMHAEPSTFGLKMLGFYAETQRNLHRLDQATDEISVCAISGAVGNFSSISPEVEAGVATKLGLLPETISTQVIPRDRYAMLFSVLAVIASSLERLAIEIRNLQRTEVAEVSEFFSGFQKGSSAMPHKHNPILSENVTGLARLVRMSIIPALENIALWHERDMSHSSVERINTPQTFMLLDFACARMNDVITNCEVDTSRMQENVQISSGAFYSQRLMLALVRAGLTRHDAYLLVQQVASAAHKDLPFTKVALGNSQITKLLTSAELDEVFNTTFHLKQVDKIFKRVLDNAGVK